MFLDCNGLHGVDYIFWRFGYMLECIVHLENVISSVLKAFSTNIICLLSKLGLLVWCRHLLACQEVQEVQEVQVAH